MDMICEQVISILGKKEMNHKKITEAHADAIMLPLTECIDRFHKRMGCDNKLDIKYILCKAHIAMLIPDSKDAGNILKQCKNFNEAMNSKYGEIDLTEYFASNIDTHDKELAIKTYLLWQIIGEKDGYFEQETWADIAIYFGTTPGTMLSADLFLPIFASIVKHDLYCAGRTDLITKVNG